MKTILLTLAILIALLGCFARSSTTAIDSRKGLEIKEKGQETVIQHEEANYDGTYSNFTQYDSLFTEQAPDGTVRTRIYGRKSNTESNVSQNEKSRLESEKAMELNLVDTTKIMNTEKTETNINSSSIESKKQTNKSLLLISIIVFKIKRK
jgi:hypothetical protein